MKTILVAGGAGYIGSHMVALLKEKGYNVIVVDNFITGHYNAIKGADKIYSGDLADKKFLNNIFLDNKIDGVINFAAYALVGESMKEPFKYYQNNIMSAVSLLDIMHKHGVKYIVFSSTCAVYGNVESLISENTETNPINPYGDSKLSVERILKQYDQIYEIKYVALRYFNAAGANNQAGIGEDHHNETHLIPLVLQTALGQRDSISIYGDDYPTADRTCVRDYIHVEDLAAAHILALEYLWGGNGSDIFNLGTGKGYSVKEIIKTVEQIIGKTIPIKIEPRRPGDPPILVAANKKAKDILGWQPTKDLNDIIHDAWIWHSTHPNGYK